ncbi:hypothetical protein LPJ66_000765 [Kickxella alabastrina]|uniref:Uncharacterized protein n=1 Tax=Kickxella alabastrina TaxID=61397 RepID=A0ACC1IV49_9FUNG|nr:hypothetical protein LPJ66_000765 [Kickxella alabastrina]
MHSADTDTGVQREELLRLILCQLTEYGYGNLSQAVATHTKVPMTTDSNSRLAELVALGLRSEQRQAQVHAQGGDGASDNEDGPVAGGGIDLNRSTQAQAQAQPPAVMPRYNVWYTTKHKGTASAAAFSLDGRYIATGSEDTSLKLIEVDRVRNPSAGVVRREDKPVIRTLYHHDAGITGVAFHPNGLVLASCSADHSVRLFDLSAAYGKHSFQSMHDNYAFRAIAFHPSGEYLAAATDASELRIFNVRSAKAYLLRGDADAHSGSGSSSGAGLTNVAYSASGALISSASRDGCVRLWDGRSGTCVRTLAQAHGGQPVTATVFSRNTKYVLTAGLDSAVRLWDVASGRLVNTYEGAAMDGLSAQAVFSHDETLVMAPDARSNSIVCWDAASAKLLGRGAEHKDRITCIAPSPTSSAFMSCSVDHSVRYWSPDC